MPNAEPPDFLAHQPGDSVAVALRDLSPGTVQGGYLSGPGPDGGGGGPVTVQLAEPVPLGHKFALLAIGAGEDVIEYGVRVAVATADIATGQHAHVHNLRSARWHRSTAR
jgi:(2R)-sulfolactate sulfo-lyase subunit alpha